MKLYQLLTEAKKTCDVSATFEGVAELLSQAGIHKSALEELRCGLKELAPAITDTGSVYSRDWMKVKESLNCVFNEAFKKIFNELMLIEDDDEWSFVASPHFDLSKDINHHLTDNNVFRTIKQLNSSIQHAIENQAPESIKQNLKNLKCLAEAYRELIEAQRVASKNVILRKRPTTTENLEHMAADSNFVLIKDSLKTIISPALDKLENQLREEYQDKIARLKNKIKMLSGKVLAPGYGEQGDLNAEQLQLFTKLFDYDVLDSYSGKRAKSMFVNIRPLGNVKSVAVERAKHERDEIEATFIAKNAKKLLAIIANKIESPTIQHEGEPKITAGLIQAKLKFTFPDGAKFTVINKVIINKSQKGNAFYQYPITFHDVMLGDGTKLFSPSEDKMINQFN